jgi:hypothetical protein
MPLIAGMTPCRIRSKRTSDVYGQEQWTPYRPAKCSVLRLRQTSGNTTVRADSSATRGHAEEVTLDGIILLGTSTTILIGDQVVIADVTGEVISIEPIFDVMGKLDHRKVGLKIG